MANKFGMADNFFVFRLRGLPVSLALFAIQFPIKRLILNAVGSEVVAL